MVLGWLALDLAKEGRKERWKRWMEGQLLHGGEGLATAASGGSDGTATSRWGWYADHPCGEEGCSTAASQSCFSPLADFARVNYQAANCGHPPDGHMGRRATPKDP